MGTWNASVAAFAETAVSSNDATRLTDAFRGALASYGLEGFACGEVDLADWRRTAFLVLEWPHDWLAFYMHERMIEADPLVGAMERRRAKQVPFAPFTWREIQSEQPRTRAVSRAFCAAADFGWREGLVVPLPRGGTRMGIVSLHGNRDELSNADRLALTTISVLYYERMRGLVAGIRPPHNAAELSAREIDCLTYVAKGMNDSEIGEKLTIARSTAHEHVERAKRKLGVRTRAEAVAIGVSMGLIVP